MEIDMKAFFLTFFSALWSLHGAAQEHPSVEQNFGSVTIHLEVSDHISNYCRLEASHLQIKNPGEYPYRDQFREKGVITVRFEQDRKKKCLVAKPPRGSLQLKKGSELPRLKPGFYKVYVNGKMAHANLQVTALPEGQDF